MLSKKSIWTKDIIGLSQITNLNEKKINCKSLWSGYTFGGNSVRSMHGVGKGFSWGKVSLREESLESIFTSATASPSAGASAGTSAIIAPLQSSCLSRNKKKVIYELRTRVLDELLKWAYIPSQLKPPSASDLRNLGPYRHQHLSPVNDQAALKPFFFSIHISFFPVHQIYRKAERNQHTKFFLYFVVQIWKSSSSPGKSRSINWLSYFPPI